MKIPRFVPMLAAAALAAAATAAQAQGYPTKPIKIISGFQPGGPTDVGARIVGEWLTKVWGQQVVVENRPGAGGNIAAEATMRAPADGYTLYLSASGAMVSNQFMYEKLPFDPEKDFAPITVVMTAAFVLVVNDEFKARSFKDFAEVLKKDGSRINYGSPGIGTLPHVSGELLKSTLRVASTHVPYRGTAPYVEGILKNEVQWSIDVPSSVIARKGKLHPLAVTVAGDGQIFLPGVPTFAALGYPQMEGAAWFALVAPAATPKDLVEKISAEVNRALRDAEFRERFTKIGYAPAPMTPAETARFFAAERRKWGPVIKANNIKVE